MEFIMKICENISSFVWSDKAVIFMLATGIYFTVFTGFFQFRRFGDVLKCTVGSIFKRRKNKTGITPFQAVSTALAGTVGTGNIAGVATAITAGGPGAVFWMTVSGIFGMMIKYAEVVLAVHFREKDKNGNISGGPMYYIEKGLYSRTGGIIFSVLCILTSFGIGNMTQSNSVATAAAEAFLIPPEISGIAIAALCGVVIMGGSGRIARFTEIIVPFMAVFYIGGAVIFLIAKAEALPGVIKLIMTSAFTTEGAVGGLAGNAVKYGIARGIFTNEAGMGSAPIAHGSADTDSAVKQGMWGIFEVFLDTIVICNLTAFVILAADEGLYYTCGEDGTSLTSGAFSTFFGGFGEGFIAVGIIFFAVAAVAGWAFYGQKAVEYITPKKRWIFLYRIIFTVLIYFGATSPLRYVWCISDALNGLMAIPNITAVILLSPIVIKLTKDYKYYTK